MPEAGPEEQNPELRPRPSSVVSVSLTRPSLVSSCDKGKESKPKSTLKVSQSNRGETNKLTDEKLRHREVDQQAPEETPCQGRSRAGATPGFLTLRLGTLIIFSSISTHIPAQTDQEVKAFLHSLFLRDALTSHAKSRKKEKLRLRKFQLLDQSHITRRERAGISVLQSTFKKQQ